MVNREDRRAARQNAFAHRPACGQIINPDGVRNQIEGNVCRRSPHAEGAGTFDRSR